MGLGIYFRGLKWTHRHRDQLFVHQEYLALNLIADTLVIVVDQASVHVEYLKDSINYSFCSIRKIVLHLHYHQKFHIS